MVYHNPKPRPGVPNDLVMTPLAMIGKIAALVPPPKWHLHRYYGVLAPNSHLRAAVTAQAPEAMIATSPQVSNAEEPHRRSLPHYLWSQLLMELLAIRLGEQTTLAKSLVMARIYEVFPLICPICHAEMQIITFVTDASTIQKILGHIGEPTQPPTISPARGPPLWETEIASEQVFSDPQWDMAAQAEPEFQYDQRISW